MTTEPNLNAPSEWRELAWDTIRLSVPAGWDIARIGLRDMLLTDGQSPRLELKWGATPTGTNFLATERKSVSCVFIFLAT